MFSTGTRCTHYSVVQMNGRAVCDVPQMAAWVGRRRRHEGDQCAKAGVHVAVMYYGTIFLTACIALSGYGSVAVCFTIPYSRMGDRHMSKNTENILGDRAIKTNHMSVKQFCHMF